MPGTNYIILRPDIEISRRIQASLDCSPVTAAVLANRMISTPEEALTFLEPSLKDLRPPSSLKDMDIGTERIVQAVLNHEKILVFGDYDVDGVSGTVILYDFLKSLQADVSYYIPHRSDEGYGFQAEQVERCLKPNQIRLLITVDCGGSSHKAVKAAKEAGTDVVVTDHHTIEGELPEAVAVINPKREDCDSGLDHLAGVGVAFYLIISLRARLRELGFWKTRPEPNLKNYCDLVCLGTLADVVPLKAENRILSKAGLEMINSCERPGIQALIKVCGLSSLADSDDLLFRLAPRINAAGRMDHAEKAVRLLLEKDPEKAGAGACELNRMNIERRQVEAAMIQEILAMLDANPHILTRNSFIIAGNNWNEGVIGIAASKIAERFYRPVVLLSVHNGLGKGSARSVAGIDLYEHLSSCSALFERFGGHRMAAGLTIKTENIERFRVMFEDAVAQAIGTAGLTRSIMIDAELSFDHIDGALLDELERLAPFGSDNSEPLFMARNVEASSSKIVGKGHRRMILRQAGERISRGINAIRFNVENKAQSPMRYDQIIFKIRWNRWNGNKIPQIIVIDP